MQLLRLLALLKGLSAEDHADLMSFLAYRHQATRLPGRLVTLLRQSDTSITKTAVCKELAITDGSFRTAKTELVRFILEWQSLNSPGWNAPSLRKLIATHTLLEWGETKQAFQLAKQVQVDAELNCNYAVARLALELRSALVQRMYPDDAAIKLKKLMIEMDALNCNTKLLRHITELYVNVATLAEKSMLLREATRIEHFLLLEQQSAKIAKRQNDMPFHLWTYHVQTQAILAQIKGNLPLSYRHLKALWTKMNTPPMHIPMADHRFYQFFLSFIDMAIRAEDTLHAHDANLLYHTAIDRFYGNDPCLLALNHVFDQIILLQYPDNMAQNLSELRATIALIHTSQQSKEGNFNLNDWDLYISTATLPLLITTCFKYQLYKECKQLLGFAKRMNAKNSGAAIDLQGLEPFIGLVVRYEELLLSRADRTSDKLFESDTNYCYHHYRKHQELYPIEWRLSRLFHGLSSGKKATECLFADALFAFERLQSETHYFYSMMQIFDFNSWIYAHAQPKAKPQLATAV
ncbi:MAG: hypothetical protein K9G41_01740 [Flavobacteriales bacterium]|nr:hypothetical protein [Flavobacteriales bacterium]